LIITTDKVYRQVLGSQKPFVEIDPLGAADPYSTSKAMADLLTQSWMASHPASKIAIARAGNVIGGGDVAENRLLPDLVRAFEKGEKAVIRNPESVRPWQHVLDCLSGYVSLSESLLSGSSPSGMFNFGPTYVVPLNVSEIADVAAASWGYEASWITDERNYPHEAHFLTLDSSLAKSSLGWKEKLSPHEAIQWTIEWSKLVDQGFNPRQATIEQVARFFEK
jgi:CDP-glucose 4,6-dehydratase